MSDHHKTPRVFLARHGETEWTISGQHTGKTDLPLTALGERQVASTGASLVGTGKLLDPAKVQRVWVSPRQRALRTFHLLFGGNDKVSLTREGQSDDKIAGVSTKIFGGGKGIITVTEDIREWDYGKYEGMKAEEVRKLRTASGLDTDGHRWSVWTDGCEGGESREDIAHRLDRLIDEIKTAQEPFMKHPGNGDIVLVAHGLILRCFFKRWLQLPIDHPLPVTMPPGALAVLSYRNHDVNQPNFHMGLTLPAEDK